ncbi:stage II sporulation protein M [Bacillaceae bacterium SIJ1]|uniref:stage II sporulation protein M n=1 Tax=Litoribacterium kuwaitense TaxID=1398745 RepID=UPI0013EE2EFD|nr:stage II sporulation protein M [Litoribacterium kuwaitense]NGP43641.1 stage II sporulation protein M [Litoribacterium kuwaitense]
MASSFQKELTYQIRQHQSLLLFTATLVFVGIIFGAIVVNSLTAVQKEDLFQYIGRFFTDVENHHLVDATIVYKQSFWLDVQTIGLMWLLGLSVIGAPIVMALVFVKGVFIGFTVGFLVSQMGWQGVGLAAAAVMPQNMLIVPVYVCCAACAVAVSVQMIKNQLSSRQQVPFFPMLRKYTMAMALLCLTFTASAGIEAWMSPFFMRMIIGG